MTIQEIVAAGKRLLTTDQFCARIGIKRNTAERWRTFGVGPKFIKLNPNSLRSPIRYREEDVEAWLAERSCSNTSQYPIPQARV